MRQIVFRFLFLVVLVVYGFGGAASKLERVVSLPSGKKIEMAEAGRVSSLIVLLHGFPETNHEWHAVMPTLAKEYRVVAVNLPGVGKSSPIKTSDKRAIAMSIFQLVEQINPKRVVIVGHDIGGMVAYAFAREYGHRTDALVIVDVPIPGLAPWDKIKNSVHAWHFNFHQMPISDQILAGRERLYLQAFYDRVGRNFKMPKASVDLYVKSYRKRETLTTAMGWYRSFDDDEKANLADLEKPMTMPVLLLSNDWGGVDQPMIGHKISQTQESVFIEGSGHWLPEERPDEVAAHILRFLKKQGL